MVSFTQLSDERGSSIHCISALEHVFGLPADSVASEKAGAEQISQRSPDFQAEAGHVFEHGLLHEPIRTLISGGSLTPLHRLCFWRCFAGGLRCVAFEDAAP